MDETTRENMLKAAFGEALYAATGMEALWYAVAAQKLMTPLDISEALDRFTLLLQEKRQTFPTGDFATPDYAIARLEEMRSQSSRT